MMHPPLACISANCDMHGTKLWYYFYEIFTNLLEKESAEDQDSF